MTQGTQDPDQHAFVRSPHRTLIGLAIPVLISLIAEPLTGLVDTAFVADLGSAALSALGVGTILLSSTFWIFAFVGIGAQTEVAKAIGAGREDRAREVGGMALAIGTACGLLLVLIGVLFHDPAASWMEAEGAVHDQATEYILIRLLGAPAVVVTVAAFGVLRGLQDMRTPLRIAVLMNAINIGLDALLIHGAGPIPAMGVAGAAWATIASHWLGAVLAVRAVGTRLGYPAQLKFNDVRELLRIGGDLFVRTGLLTGFLLLTTRVATKLGEDAGAAHQAIRQFWLFSALVLDAFSAAAQSLVGYFLGAERVVRAREVAKVASLWAFGTGVALAAMMLLGEAWIARWLVPASALGVFAVAWLPASVTQPINALSFVTDGIHWGTGDFAYLRNAMLTATGFGAVAIFVVDWKQGESLAGLWWLTAAWISIRAVLGMARVWPGIGSSPLRRR